MSEGDDRWRVCCDEAALWGRPQWYDGLINILLGGGEFDVGKLEAPGGGYDVHERIHLIRLRKDRLRAMGPGEDIRGLLSPV